MEKLTNGIHALGVLGVVAGLLALFGITAGTQENLAKGAQAATSNSLPGNVPAQAVGANLEEGTRHLVVANQVGYQTDWPKRFTAPLSPDDATFIVRAEQGGETLFAGTIRENLGDFSEFKPDDVQTEYVIEISGGNLDPGESDPFAIRENLWREQFWQTAVNFMIDCRSVVGTHPSAYGGTPWRDGTYYDFAVPSLVLMHLADPQLIESMPRQIDWAADKARVLSPEFRFDAENPHSKGVLKAVRDYYTQLQPPGAEAPDVVKMMHWGLGYYLMKPVNKDPSGDPEPWKIQAQMVEHFAYFVWAWPRLRLDRWLPNSFYDKCLEFALANWESSGCFEISKWMNVESYLTVEEVTGPNPTGGYLHPYKGRHPPGHPIVPNLLMYDVAMHKGLPTPQHYLDAAQAHTEWLIENLDWNDPRTTKGHRMSELRTVPSLVWFLQNYPDQAPDGLRECIVEWVRVAVLRSENMWDFRRFDLDRHWSIPKLNEPGNLAGFPAIALSASWVVEDEELKQRLRELATTQWDNLFGRNPLAAAAATYPEQGFPLIERGWPKKYKGDVCARIELCRGALCASPGSEMYPFNPEGMFRHSEGWVNFNTAWNVSLAYWVWDSKKKAP